MQNGFEHNSFNFEDRTFPKIDSESLSSTLSGFIKRLDTFIDYLLIKSGAKWPKNDLSLKCNFCPAVSRKRLKLQENVV